MQRFEIPDVPLELVQDAQRKLTRMWELEDLDLDDPVAFWTPPAPEDEPKPTVTERIRDAALDLESQLKSLQPCRESLEAGLCNLPSLFPYFGTTVLASAFGSRVLLREDENPACHPVFHTPEEALQIEMPDLRTAGQCKDVLERIAFFRDATDGQVPIRATDTQDPIDVATQIWHYEDLLAAMYTAPEAVHHFMDLVTIAFIEFTRIQEEVAGGLFSYGHSATWMPRGIHMSDDCAAVISPTCYREFVAPYNERIAREFGGASYHCCLKYEQNLRVIANTERFMGFDPAPGCNDVDVIEEALTGRGVWTCAIDDPALVERFRGKVGMVFNAEGKTAEEAMEKVKMLLA